MDIGNLKDLADAIDKLADTLGKIGKMLADATKAGVRVLDWRVARKTSENLKELVARNVYDHTSIVHQLIPAIDEFLYRPTPAAWRVAKSHIIRTLGELDVISEELRASRKAIATKEFFELLVESILQRQILLRKLLEMSDPESAKDSERVRALVIRYAALLETLAQANRALAHYVDELEAHGRYGE